MVFLLFNRIKKTIQNLKSLTRYFLCYGYQKPTNLKKIKIICKRELNDDDIYYNILKYGFGEFSLKS